MLEKKYYTIGEVASELNVTASLIRFWEGQFDQIKPKKGKNGVRHYTRADIETLKTIYFLVKTKGYTLQGAKDKLKAGEAVQDSMQTLDTLRNLKLLFLELKSKLQ
jgi:DNA-binding transcriptional MerR regulator